MAHDHSAAPAPDSYRFILRKLAEHDPEIPERVSGYDEQRVSVPITHRDGHRRRTLFVSSEYFRDRLLRLGWEDVSAMFKGAEEPSPATQTSPAPAPAPASETPKGKPPRSIRVAG